MHKGINFVPIPAGIPPDYCKSVIFIFPLLPSMIMPDSETDNDCVADNHKSKEYPRKTLQPLYVEKLAVRPKHDTKEHGKKHKRGRKAIEQVVRDSYTFRLPADHPFMFRYPLLHILIPVIQLPYQLCALLFDCTAKHTAEAVKHFRQMPNGLGRNNHRRGVTNIIQPFVKWKIQCKLPPKTKRFCPLVLK